MEYILKMISESAANGTIADTTLILITIAVQFLLYKYILAPMKNRVDNIATVAEVTACVNSVDDVHVKTLDIVLKKLDELEKKVEQLEDCLKVEQLDRNIIKRDIESIKTILNQFQGHMLYNNNHGEAFGKIELK